MKTTTFYILHGDDDLKVEEEADRLCTKLASGENAHLNTDQFDGTVSEIGEILGAVLAFPFLSDVRLVVVKDLISHVTRKGAGNTGKKALEMLIDQLPKLPEWSRLVLIERQTLDDKNKLVQLARSDEHGSEKMFPAPKDSTQWIMKRAQEAYQVKIEPTAAAALASVTGQDLRLADRELQKLAIYIDPNTVIHEADVAALTAYVPEANLFAMADAMAEGRTPQAIQLLHRLVDQQQDIFGLYGMIIRQFRLMLLAKEHLSARGDPRDLPSVLGAAPYSAEKAAKQARGLSVEKLEQIYRLLQEYDLKIKTGQIEPKLAVEMLIASLGR